MIIIFWIKLPMLKILSYLLLAIVPYEPLEFQVEEVDMLEINTVNDPVGGKHFTQVLALCVGGPEEILWWQFDSGQLDRQLKHQSSGLFYFPRSVEGPNSTTYTRYFIHVRGAVIRSITSTDPEVDRRQMQPLLFRRIPPRNINPVDRLIP